MHAPTNVSLVRYARIAGGAYLIIIAAGIYAEFFVRSSLIVPADAAATARNIREFGLLFRSAIASELVMLVCDVLAAVALYIVFEGVSRSVSLLAAFFRLVHAAIVGGNLLNAYVPLLLLADAEHFSRVNPDELQALVLVSLQAHSYGYVIGLVFFGFQCLFLGYLVFTSDPAKAPWHPADVCRYRLSGRWIQSHPPCRLRAVRDSFRADRLRGCFHRRAVLRSLAAGEGGCDGIFCSRCFLTANTLSRYRGEPLTLRGGGSSARRSR